MRDLIKRHEAVSSLASRSRDEVAATERAMATAQPALARKLKLELVNKRRFLAILEARLEVLATELGENERQQLQILANMAKLPGPSKH